MMNSQPAQGDFYTGYAGGPMSHSPNSARPGYATTVGVPSALSTGGRRNNQQQGASDAGNPSANSSLYGSDDRFASFEAPQRFDRGTATPSSLQNAFSMFGTPNQQASWTYNPAAAATMNGPISDGTRLRGANRRPALHPEWTTNTDSPMATQATGHNIPFYQTQQHLVGQPIGLPSASSPDPFSVPPPQNVNLQSYGEMRGFNDPKKDMGDLIPTAIVIKNIPFNVRKEYLTSVMIDMHLPQPYAFNYHFDQGVFRGLAFANFQNAQDTAMVIERMNGLDIQGRKLRVEYKKMLPEHERERIEREKREKRGQLEEQHRGPSHQISMSSMGTSTPAPRPAPIDRFMDARIDLNDPNTLQLYLDLYLFQKDDSREVYIFPAETSPRDRRVIHVLAHNMGIEHTSLGEGENRQVHVSKSKFATAARQGSTQQTGVTLDGHPRGLSRAATYDFNDRQHPSIHSIGRGPTLAIPSSPENHPHGLNGLRGVKSVADLRSFSPSPSPSMISGSGLAPPPTNGHAGAGGPPGMAAFLAHYPNDGLFGPSLGTPTTPSGMNPPSAGSDTSGLVNGLGALGLGSTAFDSSTGNNLSGRPRETPGAIGSQRPSANGNNNNNSNTSGTGSGSSSVNNGSRANPERQPRGPGGDWENPGGFSRGRANGHMPRGSDSSDNTGRSAHGSAALF